MHGAYPGKPGYDENLSVIHNLRVTAYSGGQSRPRDPGSQRSNSPQPALCTRLLWPPAVTAATGIISTIAPGLVVPYGVAVDGAGNIYIADSGSSLVEEVTAATGGALHICRQWDSRVRKRCDLRWQERVPRGRQSRSKLL
jgi:DNA-binding beta-propeller fold protein YncE